MTLPRSILSDAPCLICSQDSRKLWRENCRTPGSKNERNWSFIIKLLIENTGPIYRRHPLPYQQLLWLHQPMDRPSNISNRHCCPKVQQGLRAWRLFLWGVWRSLYRVLLGPIRMWVLIQVPRLQPESWRQRIDRDVFCFGQGKMAARGS